MRKLKFCISAAVIIAAFLIPQAAFASISPLGAYDAGDIIEAGDIALTQPGETAYYKINKINDANGDVLLSVFGGEAFSFALGYENDFGEFTEYDNRKDITVDPSLESDPEYSHQYIRYSGIADVNKGHCYLKATNISTKVETFRGSVTNVCDYGTYTFGSLKETTFGRDCSVVYHYHPQTEIEKNCLVLLYGMESGECALDYFMVDAEGNALNFNIADPYSSEHYAYGLNDADYEFYFLPSLSESLSGEGITGPASPVPYRFGILPQDLKDYTITLSKTSYTYNGKKKKPSVTVKYGDIKLIYDDDYYLTYANNKNAGTGKVTVRGYGGLSKGSVTKTFKIKKAPNPMTVSVYMNKSTKAEFLKRQSQPFGYMTISKAKGKVKQKVKYANAKSKKALTFYTYSDGGNLVIKKGTKKGTYKVTVIITSGTKNYKTKTITKTVTVRIK